MTNLALYPEEAPGRLRATGWSVRLVPFSNVKGTGWTVTGTRGDHSLWSQGRTKNEAWSNALLILRNMGLLNE